MSSDRFTNLEKGLMRDQVRIKNVEIRVIKRDRVRNDDREKKNEERESNG